MITIRASYLTGYNDCSRRVAARLFKQTVESMGYVLRDTPKNAGSIIGTGVHAGACSILTEKAGGLDVPHEGAAVDAGVMAVDAEMESGEVLFDDVTKNESDIKKQVHKKILQFNDEVTPEINPVATEERMNAVISDSFILSGQVDWREDGAIGDLKTGKMQQFNAPQYGAYSLLLRSSGLEVNCINEFYLKVENLSKPNTKAKKTSYDTEQCESMAQATIADMVSDYEKFVATGNRFSFRANPSSLLCSDKYCPAWGTNFCREHEKNG